ncbi:MAG: hypothetical protein C4292_03810 [Nitrososphaera sp.]
MSPTPTTPSSFKPAEGERVLLTEDCSEDKLKSGVLILTNMRILFQKTEGRMATLSKKEGDVVLDIPLGKVTSFSGEGFLVKKFVITTTTAAAENGQETTTTYKFGVFSNSQWQKRLKQAQQQLQQQQ